jgi:RpiR family carbohydrate utilization transcriptional regulator
VASFAPKIFDTAINNLVRVRENICHQRINQIVEAFIKARRIYFFGLGSSGIVARDAANQFLKLNLPVSSSDDILNQKMFASSSHKQDVFFLVSDTNDNQEMIEVAQIAKKMAP